MSDFDWEKAEEGLKLASTPVTLRERAAIEWTTEQVMYKRDLLVTASEMFEEILGEYNAEDVTTDLNPVDPELGTVEGTIDNLRFKVVVGSNGPALLMRTRPNTWDPIKRLADVGRHLEKMSPQA